MSPRVAVVGTFDVANFGDLLFPMLACRELTARIPGCEVIPFSYQQMSACSWPFDVRPLRDLAGEIDNFDLLLVGGGDLVRFDKDVAPGYGPADIGLQHPTAYWLMPTILAAGRGVPVAWNAIGVLPDTPVWAEPMLRQAIDAVDYVAVRDQASAAELRRIGAGERLRIVPDTAFSLRALLPNKGPSRDFKAFAKTRGLDMPYVVVHAAAALTEHASTLRRMLGVLQSKGYKVLELPIGPVHGDRCGLLGIEDAISGDGLIEAPLLLAEVVANSDAIVAMSLHLSIAGLVHGVPVNRFTSLMGRAPSTVGFAGCEDVHSIG